MNVYLDNAASTKTDERVLEAMLPYLKEHYGNPSSTHRQGKLLKVLIEESREAIADFFGTKPKEIFFTSGGTESNNFAIKGLAFINGTGSHYITSSTEHPAVLDTFTYLRKFGYDTEIIKPNSEGLITREILEPHLKENTKLVSVMHANNETGTVNDIKSISELCKSFGAAFHSDTVQSVGKTSVKPKELGIDFLTVSAHKIYGPKGVGILFVDESLKIDKYFHGGGQERNMRGGTENAAGIAGLKKAIEILKESMQGDIIHYGNLKNLFLKELDNNFKDKYRINGSRENTLNNIVNVSFLPYKINVPSGMLPIMLDLKEVSVSGGSACSSGSVKPSNVLLDLGVDERTALSSIRVSFGRFNTEKDVQILVKALKEILIK